MDYDNKNSQIFVIKTVKISIKLQIKVIIDQCNKQPSNDEKQKIVGDFLVARKNCDVLYSRMQEGER